MVVCGMVVVAVAVVVAVVVVVGVGVAVVVVVGRRIVNATRTHVSRLIEHDHLQQGDLMRSDGTFSRPTVVIESAALYVPRERRKVRRPDGQWVPEPLKKLILTFRAKRLSFVCNTVNRKTIVQIYGPIIEDWIGKPITLYVDEKVTFGRTTTGGIRVVNTRPSEAPTDDPLDNAVDMDRVRLIAEAAEFAEVDDAK